MAKSQAAPTCEVVGRPPLGGPAPADNPVADPDWYGYEAVAGPYQSLNVGRPETPSPFTY